MFNCKHKLGTNCKLGHMNYRPSDHYCSACQDYEGKARGLGDIIHSVASATGLDKLAKKIEEKTQKPCGCKERRTKLNQLLPRKTD